MLKKTLYFLLTFAVLALLVACSSLPIPGIAGSAQQSGNASANNSNGQNPSANFANQPVEEKLAIGTLKLEDTNLAVTPEEAKQLLPLWKAVKSLSSSTTASPEEITALYTQIQDTMSAEQVQAIKDMNLTPQETQALMQKYGVQFPQGGFNGQGNLSQEERATRIAQFQSQNGGQGRGQGFQGVPGNGFPQGGFSSGGNNGFQRTQQPNAQGTPQPGFASRRQRGGFNLILVDPLIKMLEAKAGG